MKKNLFTLFYLAIYSQGLFCADNTPNPLEILTQVMNRLENVDQSYVIDMEQTQTGKPDIHRKLWTRVGWNEGGILQSIRIDYLQPKEMRGVVFWEHRFEDQSKRRWRTLPVTGKLKEIKKNTEKSIKKKGFDFSELELSPKLINSHVKSFLGIDTLLNREMYIIESQDTTSRENDRETKRFWIDPERHLIMKLVILDGKGRVSKIAECTEVFEVDHRVVYRTIEVTEMKRKINISINISDYSFKKNDEPEIFIPVDQ